MALLLYLALVVSVLQSLDSFRDDAGYPVPVLAIAFVPPTFAVLAALPRRFRSRLMRSSSVLLMVTLSFWTWVFLSGMG